MECVMCVMQIVGSSQEPSKLPGAENGAWAYPVLCLFGWGWYLRSSAAPGYVNTYKRRRRNKSTSDFHKAAPDQTWAVLC